MRITVDTNILISSLGWNGAESAIIEMVLESKLELCLSTQILGEFYRVVRYPKFGFSDGEIDGFIGRLLAGAVLVEPGLALSVITEDPDDNKVIECAVEGNSRYIISGDRHLLNLGKYQGIEIMRAPDFIKEILRG